VVHQSIPPQPSPPRQRRRRQRFRPERPTWSWQGLVAFLLALAIIGGIVVLVIGVIANIQNQPLPENIGGMLTAVISALIGSVATFLGRVGSNNPEEQAPEKNQSNTTTTKGT
jgi:polyferredoxin